MKNRICIFIRLSVYDSRDGCVRGAVPLHPHPLPLFRPARPGTARYCVYMHIYRGKPPDSPLYSNSAAFSDIPARNSRPKSPGLRIHRFPTHPIPVHSLSLRARSRRLSCATVKPSYSDKIERIPPKRLRVSAVHPFVRPTHSFSPLPPSLSPLLSFLFVDAKYLL